MAASSTSVDGHTGWLIEDIGGSPKLPAHVNTHLSRRALSLPPFRLYTCTHRKSAICNMSLLIFVSVNVHIDCDVLLHPDIYQSYKSNMKKNMLVCSAVMPEVGTVIILTNM